MNSLFEAKYPEPLRYPDWVAALLEETLRDKAEETLAPEECMRLANEAAYQNVLAGGGPFGAVIADRRGRVMSIGTNRVVDSHDSTAHAEILAIRRIDCALKTHDLQNDYPEDLLLYSSCTPCIMCFGAIWWAGLSEVFSSTTRDDAEQAGFVEGPVVPKMWELLLIKKGVKYTAGFCRNTHALRAFEAFSERGTLY